MQNNIPMSFSVMSEYFDVQSGEKYDELSIRASGCLQKKDKEYRLLYKDKDKDTELFTEIVFTPGEDKLTVNKKGDVECKLLFTKGKKQSFIYRLAYASFDAEIYTHNLYNTVAEQGGEISVLYTLTLGGQKQKISMHILAEAIKK